ncbi:hypothetical protein [Methanocella arvoryzae]|nr:hypothetical protein [Methanocella arvoryzae]
MRRWFGEEDKAVGGAWVEDFDCRGKILSDVPLMMLEVVDWQCFQYLDKDNKIGRPPSTAEMILLLLEV